MMTKHPVESQEDHDRAEAEISEFVKLALIQAGDIQSAEDKMKKIVAKSSKITPPSRVGRETRFSTLSAPLRGQKLRNESGLPLP